MQQLNLKLTPEEIERIRRLVERVQTRVRKQKGYEAVEVSARSVVMSAIASLEAYYDRLERDKERER